MNYIVTTLYIIMTQNQHSIFIFHYFKTKLYGKHHETSVWQLCDSCQIIDLINFQNLTWANSCTPEICLNSGLNTVKLLTYMQKLSIHLALVLETSHYLIQILSILSINFGPVA